MSAMRVGIAGLGVVGGGLLKILIGQQNRVARTGTRFELGGVSARNRNRDRGVPLEGIAWFDDPVELAKSDDIDIFVELIGGADGSARIAVETAISAGKHVVTANKALIAEHGPRLSELAEKAGVCLNYEAAVAGGIPAIRALRDGIGMCTISQVTAILNGTCNYIMSEMARTGATYEDALEDAKRLGYAEADPSFDVGGIDAAHKLAIIATIAFDAAIRFDSISIKGIEDIAAQDVAAAGKLGYRIKLLAITKSSEAGLGLRVHPALVDEAHSLARAEGAGNILVIDSDPLGQVELAGPGAGAGATAAAVAADLLSIARGARGPVFNTPATQLKRPNIMTPENQSSRFYLRIQLKDVPGAIAAITETLAKHSVSIDSLLQPSVEKAGNLNDVGNGGASVVLTTHQTRMADIDAATLEITGKPFALGKPSLIRIEDFH